MPTGTEIGTENVKETGRKTETAIATTATETTEEETPIVMIETVATETDVMTVVLALVQERGETRNANETAPKMQHPLNSRKNPNPPPRVHNPLLKKMRL